jgi:hypothetical protein
MAVLTMGALMKLALKDGPSGDPDPRALDDMLAAEAVVLLLCLVDSPRKEAALAAIELLQLIARDPRGMAALAETHSARSLIAALGTAFSSPLVDPGDSSMRNVRADIVGVIGQLVEGRPAVGRAFLAAGVVREVAGLLGPARDVTERKFAMELVDKLVRHAPGACDVMKAEGVFTQIHRLTAGEPILTTLHVIGRGEVTLPMFDEEPSQAQMLMFTAAARSGGVLEIAETGKKPAVYKLAEVMDPHPGTWEATLTPPPGSPQAPPAPFPLCIYAGPMRAPGTQEPLPTPSPGMPQAIPPRSPLTPEAAPPSCPGTPEAGAATSPGTPKACATPSPETPKAAPSPRPGTPESGAPPSPGTPEAVSGDAAERQKLRSHSLETPDPAPANVARRQKPPHQSPGTPVVVTSQPVGAQNLPHPGPRTPEVAGAAALGRHNPPLSGAGMPETAAADTARHARVRRPSRRVCVMCGTVSKQRFQVCTRCRTAAYCGKDCQAAHWPVHKGQCRG